jgi:hypothetical protein
VSNDRPIKPAFPGLDLDTVRETLTYIRDDLQRVPGLQSAAEALGAALREIDHCNKRLSVLSQGVISSSFFIRKH